MINRVFDQRIIEEIQIDEMGIARIGDRRYNYMMVPYELGNLSGTLELRGELGHIRRSHFSKPQVFASIRGNPHGIRGIVLCSTFQVRSLNSQGPARLFACTESTISLHNVAAAVGTAGVTATSG